MPRTEIIVNSFTGGELSPNVLGRTDLAKYHNGMEKCSNFIVKYQGGISRRFGSRYITDATGPSRLIPFILSATQSYILEFGNQTLRFYTQDGQIQAGGGGPYQITTPYNTATDDLWDIKFVQIASVMYLVHPNHAPQKLIRVSDNNWSLIQPAFYAAPATKQDQDVSGGTISVTVSLNSVVASAGVFIAGDVGKAVVAGTGRGIITGVSVSSGTDNNGAVLYTQAQITVTDPFDSASYTAGNWKLRGGPLAYFAVGSFTGNANSSTAAKWKGNGKFAFGKSVTVVATTNQPTDSSWQHTVAGANVDVQYNPSGLTDSFRSIDVGNYVPFAGGYGIITQLGPASAGGSNAVAAQVATVTILSVPTVVEQNAWGNSLISSTPPGGWQTEVAEFGGSNFPRAVTLFGDRLWFASTPNNPQTFWGSNVGDYENFALGTLDADGIRFTINSGILDQVLWMLPYGGGIVAGTLLDEYIINGGAGQQVVSAGAPITPSNINQIRQSSYGNSRIQPLVVNNDLIYVQRSQQKAYEFSFNPLTSSFGSRDLNLLNEIITTTAFKEMVFQNSPNKTIWFTDNSGNLVGLTYQKDQDVWAWHRHFTGVDGPDSFVSIASIPTSSTETGSGTTLINQDELWMVCKRIRNGVYVYTIEQFDIGFPGYVDCASFNIFGSPVTSISGLGYLQGRTVFVVADGAILPSVVMGAAGTYAFPPGFSAKNVQAGLNYVSDMVTVRPEPKTTVQGLIKRWAKLWIRIYQSLFVNINNQVIPYNQIKTPLGQATPLFTGDVNINNLGRDRDGRIEVTQNNPLPCNLLCIFGNLEISDGI